MTVSATAAQAEKENAEAHAALRALWAQAELPAGECDAVHLPGQDPVVESSFRVAAALQAGIGAGRARR